MSGKKVGVFGIYSTRVAIRLLVVMAFDELGSVFDLFLGPVDVNYFVFAVYPIDHPGGQQDPLTEDPWSGVNLADTSIYGFDRPTGQISTGGSLIRIPPQLWLNGTHNHHLPFTCWTLKDSMAVRRGASPQRLAWRRSRSGAALPHRSRTVRARDASGATPRRSRASRRDASASAAHRRAGRSSPRPAP